MTQLQTIVANLAEEFRSTAAESDRTGAFPSANYQRMREAGYLRAAVPTELGGLGAGLTELAQAQQLLATGCASTALAVNMHQFQVGALSDAWRKGGPDALLRRVAQEGIVLASTGAEAIVAGEWAPATTAKRCGGEYVLNGRKFFCSQAPQMDLVRVNARDVDSGETLVFSLAAQTPGLRIVETWDTTGMRATASHDLLLEEARVGEEALVARIPEGAPMHNPALANLARWFLTLTASVYLGIAQEARAEAHRLARSQTSNRHPLLTDVLLGELEAEWFCARAVRDQALSELDPQPDNPQQALMLAILCKEGVIERSRSVVEKAIQIVGGRAYFRRSLLERLQRDVQAARFHPPAAPVSFQMIGERLRQATNPTGLARNT